MILAVVADLLFGSKIRSVARTVGRDVTFVGRDVDIDHIVRAVGPALVIVDLGQPGAAEAIRAVRGVDGPSIPIVAFASHVRADLIAAGREAGADRVLARSAFVAELPALLAAAVSSTP